MFKRSMIVLFILVSCVTISSVCLAGSDDLKVLKITTHSETYANLYKPITIPFDAENITLEYYAKVDAGMYGYSVGPAVHFWWDTGLAVAIKVDSIFGSSRSGNLRFYNPRDRKMQYDGYETGDDLPVPIYGGVWYGYKIQLDSEKVRFYIREVDGDWVELELARKDRGENILFPPDGLIVGTGGSTGFGPNPFFRNSYPEERKVKSNVRSVYFDNIVVTVDGKVVFVETFERSIDELKNDWDFAIDPINEEPVLEVVSEE